MALSNKTNLNLRREEQEEDTSTELTATATLDSSFESAYDRRNSERLTRVAFTSIQIRSFNRVAGDHPDVQGGGPPLAIGWEFVEQEPIDLDDYEQEKAQAKADSDTPWLFMFGLQRLSSGKRRNILRVQFEIPIEDINAAEAEAQRVRKLRARTNSQKKVFARAEELMQSAKRRLQRKLNTPAVRCEERLLAAALVATTPKQTLALKQEPMKKQSLLPMEKPTSARSTVFLPSLPPMSVHRPMAAEISA